MTRRAFLSMAAIPSRGDAPLAVPVHRVIDRRLDCPPDQLHHFWASIWPEAVRTFSAGGVQLSITDGSGEIRRSPGDRPIFTGLERRAVNLVLTDHIPLSWDKARALAGVTTIWEGYHVCLVAIRYAHGNQVPFLSVNTCVHELLHALLQDVFVSRATLFQGVEHESRVDWYATLLWLFHDGRAIRESGRGYVNRLRGS